MPDYSTGPGWTPVDDVAAAASRAGVLVSVLDDDGPPEHREVVVTAHDGPWSVHRDRQSVLGWVACRVDPTGWPVPRTLGWLGAADADGPGLIERLLSSSKLPTDLRGQEQPVLAAHPLKQTSPADAYVRCTTCGWTCQQESLDYALTPDGQPDLTLPVEGLCGVCGHKNDDVRGWAVPADDGTHPCSRCSTVTKAPADAARIRCSGCGLHVLGSGLTPDDRESLAAVERQRADGQRARIAASRAGAC